jgi:hypothetical protein
LHDVLLHHFQIEYRERASDPLNNRFILLSNVIRQTADALPK